MFFDSNDFAYCQALEAAYPVIKAEFLSLRAQYFLDWPEKHLYDDGWKVFGLWAYGQRIEQACALCPETAKLLNSFDGLFQAGFSRLAPSTHIKPHKGLPKSQLRCHLGIDIPADCAIRVEQQTQTWREGECLLFDDTLEHEAWNKGERDRIVLLVDIPRTAAIVRG